MTLAFGITEKRALILYPDSRLFTDHFLKRYLTSELAETFLFEKMIKVSTYKGILRFLSLLGLDFKLRDLTLQLEALSRVLDDLDAQISTNIQEIITVRIPEAMYYVERDLIRSNNLWYTGALFSGQILFFSFFAAKS